MGYDIGCGNLAVATDLHAGGDFRHALPGLMDRIFAEILRRSDRPVLLAANKAEGKAGEAGALDAYSLGFGEPIQLQDYADRHLPDWRTHFGDETDGLPEGFKRFVADLALENTRRINAAAVANPTARRNGSACRRQMRHAMTSEVAATAT